MHIEEFMFRAQLSQNAMALLLGISPSILSRTLTGKQKFDKELALQVEQLTKGKVTRDECLFPEKYPDWRLK